jgi:3-oxoacyl-[acyl-carrier-protein] synthase II
MRLPTPIAVTGVGLLSPIGLDEASFRAAIAGGESALRRESNQPFCTGRIGDFVPRKHIAPGNLRRMPRLSQITIVAAKQALAEAKLPYHSDRIGVVLGTGLGTLEETIQFMNSYLDHGPEGASPLLFPMSVMNAAAGQLALECQLRGLNSTVNHRDASALEAILFACHQLALGRADALLVGSVDELSPSTLEGYRLMGRLSGSPLRPYDRDRDGLSPSEAATLFVLEREEDAKARGARIRARLLNCGESGDSRPRIGWGKAPDPSMGAEAVAEAVRTAPPIGWVAGGANGTELDQLEVEAVRRGVGALPPISSVLGQVGESHSSAMVRAATAVFALEDQRAPGTVGLTAPLGAPDDPILRAPRDLKIEAVLVPTFSQGGANVAIVLER